MGTGDIDANDRYVPESLTPNSLMRSTRCMAHRIGLRVRAVCGAKADFTELEAVQAKRSTAEAAYGR